MQSRNASLPLVLALCFGAAPGVLASASNQPTPQTSEVAVLETLKGTVRSISEESFVLMVDEQAQTVHLGQDTKYFLDGKEARKDQVLKANQEVSVDLADGVASKVSTRSK
jgi:hypothetical protein